MKYYLLLFVFLVSFCSNAQEINLPKNPKQGEKYMYCYSADSNEKWVKVLSNPSKKTTEKNQSQLNYLGYVVVETGVFDFQTKNQLKKFNTENNLGDYALLLAATETLLKNRFKEKRKSDKNKS
ncbi:hypothetical protein FG167_09070 [Lacinutrix sp. WUR7]|uniref:hypothetical protein n=1 Tax=Lacinutrix sp. WUR7 TaxID=2653681 RepID=UPI00193CE4D9|nr:hypothetical protein [Lacinutrix sp. WUR7]QRM89381.1 hypothetical protein FG167_09070 [Lacinutrix sp. WUR7]